MSQPVPDDRPRLPEPSSPGQPTETTSYPLDTLVPPRKEGPPSQGQSGEAQVAVSPDGKGYRLLKRIGQGSFAEVYRSEAPGGIPVAVKKIMKPVSQAEAQRELGSLELIKRLRHPFLL